LAILRPRTAAEVATALETSAAAVNSALQRARARFAAAGLDEDAVTEPTDAGQGALLDRYARAIEQMDVAALVDMFTAEARWEMPPFLAWYRGPQDIARLVAVQCPVGLRPRPLPALRPAGPASRRQGQSL